jgi:hypothetical protein
VRLAIGICGALLVAGCTAGISVIQRFPDDVQTALARDDMRRLETERFIIYYAAPRAREAEAFVRHAGACVDVLRDAAVIHDGPWHDKMVIAMPDAAFNNAFVIPEAGGYEHVAVIPTVNTLDFTSEYGLIPDPSFIACHELVHYVNLEQIAGFWRYLDLIFGHLYTPQVGDDPWFLEGLATHYEAALQPGVGRPTWPIFTGMFAAGYAGQRVNGGDLSELGRLAPVGHQYLVGSMFVRFLTERYGEPAIWRTIASQASALTGLLFAPAFKAGFGVSFGTLLDQFEAWHQQTFPARERPAGQRALARLGDDARYARGRDGTEAWVASDVDAPDRLVVRAPDGVTLADISLVDIVPPRTLVIADPLMVSGLSVTADGREVWLTAIDLGSTFQVPRLLRWRRGERRLTELSDALGPGATIDPRGSTYFFFDVDGDRWNLAAWDVARGTRRTLLDMAPGTYALAAQISRDGARLAVDVWDGHAFVIWIVDAATGRRLDTRGGAGGTPVWDASLTDDDRVMYLGEVEQRFQVFVDGQAVSDAPYAVLAPRAAGGTIRMLNRDGWAWTLDEIALPATEPAPAPPADDPVAVALAPPSRPPGLWQDEPFHAWDHLFVPQLHALTIVTPSTGTPHVGAVIGGGDQLGIQRWAIAGYGQYAPSITDHVHWGADAAYLNNMLAPWQILATAGFVDWVDPVAGVQAGTTVAEARRTRDLSLSISRTWRGTLTTLASALYSDDFDQLPGESAVHDHIGGGLLDASWVFAESTPYTGARRGWFGDASVAAYPAALSTFRGDIYDTRGELGAIIPLPFGRRHVLFAELRGRALLARDDTGLLQLGGSANVLYSLSASSVATTPTFDAGRFPADFAFIENLRGYEDYAITTDRAAIADVWWRYPIIIDRGVAATLWWLPATFLSELDLELFASGAMDRAGDLHAAGGGQITANLRLFRVPLRLSYQIARRVRDDDALTHLFGLDIPLEDLIMARRPAR